jgi:glycosyltransferase involved in cell wall biosynthesis
MKVTVIIPTHDRPGPLKRVVESLTAQTLQPDTLIIVNDGQTEIETELADIVAQAGVEFQIVRRAEPSSACSRNAGLAEAKGDIVVFFDDDMILDHDLLEKLVDIYRRDCGGIVAGITLRYRDEPDTWQWRLWEIVAAMLGRMRWSPRRQLSRYVQLGPDLAGKLEPTARMSSGAMSLRGDIARQARFDEEMKGYAFGEDRDLSYRLGRTCALFRTREVWILHAPEPGGRGAMFQRGWAYVDNSLRIASRSVEGGAGTFFLIGYDFAGAILQYTLWGLVRFQKGNIAYASGIASALCNHAWRKIRESICE